MKFIKHPIITVPIRDLLNINGDTIYQFSQDNNSVEEGKIN